MKAVLFDAYGTLFDEGRESIPVIAHMIGEEFEIPKEEVLSCWAENYFRKEAQFSTNFMTILEANKVSLQETFKNFKLPVRLSEKYYQTLVQRWSNPPLFKDVLPVLERLVLMYRVGIISNGEELVLQSAIRTSGIPVSYCLSSERAGLYKPNPKIFSFACEELNIEKKDMIYVGNSSVDVIGAKCANLTMIHLNRHSLPSSFEGYHPDFVVNTMNEVEIIVGDLANLVP